MAATSSPADESSKAPQSVDNVGIGDGLKDTVADDLRNTLEDLFSPINLRQDQLLRSKMDKAGFVNLDVIARLGAIRTSIRSTMGRDVGGDETLDILKYAISRSRHLQFETDTSDDAKSVRFIQNTERKTLIIRDLKDVTQHEISDLFNSKPHSLKCGKIVSIRMDIGNNWFLGFESEEDCLKSFKYLTNNHVTLNNKTLHVRVKPSERTHPLAGHGHGLAVENELEADSVGSNIKHRQTHVSDYAQSPILQHTGITPYGPVNYEQYAYDQMFKSGKTPPPTQETQNTYEHLLAAQQVQAQARAQQAQAQAQLQYNQQIQQIAAQQQQQQQRGQQRGGGQRVQGVMPNLILGRSTVDNEQQRQPPPVMGSPPTAQAKHQQYSKGVPSGTQQGTATGGVTGGSGVHRKQHIQRQSTCDYPRDNFAKYSQKKFLEVYASLKKRDELIIPHSMRGRDHRIVSEEVLEPVSLKPTNSKMTDKKKARDTRDTRDRGDRGDRQQRTKHYRKHESAGDNDDNNINDGNNKSSANDANDANDANATDDDRSDGNDNQNNQDLSNNDEEDDSGDSEESDENDERREHYRNNERNERNERNDERGRDRRNRYYDYNNQYYGQQYNGAGYYGNNNNYYENNNVNYDYDNYGYDNYDQYNQNYYNTQQQSSYQQYYNNYNNYNNHKNNNNNNNKRNYYQYDVSNQQRSKYEIKSKKQSLSKEKQQSSSQSSKQQRRNKNVSNNNNNNDQYYHVQGGKRYRKTQPKTKENEIIVAPARRYGTQKSKQLIYKAKIRSNNTKARVNEKDEDLKNISQNT